jgi:hypothetical protein
MLCHNDSHRAFVPGLAGGDVDADADAGAGAGAGAGIYRPLQDVHGPTSMPAISIYNL